MLPDKKMKNIQPTYVTFEQAKLLKEKGFVLGSKKYYGGHGWNVGDDIKHYEHGLCTNNTPGYFEDVCEAPEQWQVVEWLRVNYGIWISVQLPTWSSEGYWYSYQIITLKYKVGNTYYDGYEVISFPESMYTKYSSTKQHLKEGFNSPQEAYSAAFDYILSTFK